MHCQYQRNEVTTLRAARKRQESKASQKFCRPSKGLGRRRGSTSVLRTPICPRDHPFRGHKLPPQWSSYRAFWHWQDKRVGRPEILLAELEQKRQTLCPTMWRLSDFKNRPPQTIWRPAVLVCPNSSIERPLHGLCDWLTIVRGLEGRQLQVNSCHCWPIDQDSARQASQSYHWCSGTSGTHHKRGSLAPLSTRLNCNR